MTTGKRVIPGTTVPSLNLLEGIVSTRMLDAARIASEALTQAGIPHALAGGLAVGAWGYLRATKDIDFIVGETAFVKKGVVVSFKPGIPSEVNGVKIKILSNPKVDEQTENPQTTRGVPVIEVEALIYLKLVAFRRQDKLDIVELLKAGSTDEREVRKYLGTIGAEPEIKQRFETLVQETDEER